MTALLLDASDLRRERRIPVDVPTCFAIAEGAAHVGQVENISRHGVLIVSDAAPAVGDKASIELPNLGDTDSIVVWTAAARFGCQFATPIPVAAFALLLTELGVA